MTVKIVNLYKEPYDIYIGRSKRGESYNIWCNPFNIDESKGETREVVIAKFKVHLWKMIKEGKVTVQDLLDLDGKTLGCFCKPKECHGDIIKDAVEWAKDCIKEKTI